MLLLVVVITMTVFFRTTMHRDTVDDGIVFLGSLYFALIMILFNGFTEVSLLMTKLPVLYKHMDLHFYPPWAYTLPSWVLSIPTSLVETTIWVGVTYYVVGYDPQITRFLRQYLLLFFLHQMSLGLFRVMASLGRNMIVSNTFGSFAMLVVMILGGFIISRESIPRWWIWGYWISPLMYAQNAVSVNEFLGHSWDKAFVEEVMELVELTPLGGALVGLPGVNGLSTEQRKRLTIAVELVANPSIVFMDEPTSGLDARAVAIVMRAVRNIGNTGRTIVCTIHQPSIDIFESFDELLFMKRGGQLIYAGPLGPNSRKLVEFFEAIPGVPKIKDGYNPAAWMLEVTCAAMETRLGVDFAEYYRGSKLFRQNKDLVKNLSRPNSEAKELSFPTKYSQSFFSQYFACLWKQNLSYWRNPQYTAVRFFYTVIISLMFGTICWGFGSKRDTQQQVFNAMGSMYAAVLFIGITNATAVQPVVSIERYVTYRERAAGMYSALPFAFAQVSIEFPYVFVQTLIYGTIFYSMAMFEWTMTKFLWYIFFMYFTLLYFTFFGMMTTAITPNHNVAPIIAAPFYTLWNLFCGFMIVRRRIPVWWRWYYWANPVSWSLYGLLTSQFGDINEPMLLSDGVSTKSVQSLLEDHFGYRHEFMDVVGIMVVGFCVLFAVIFALAIKYLNFQRR